MFLVSVLLAWPLCVIADIYLNNPRGSNNKLSEQSNTVQNKHRLFDSQNDAAGGYQIGDNCRPVCQDANQNYDATKLGAMQGAMNFFAGSELYIEWHNQHGCGVGHPNVQCQLVLQYMCEGDNPGLRDGTKRGAQNTAGGAREPPRPEEANATDLGQHEPLHFYLSCKRRDRNRGLYTADQNVRNDRGATATRQNPNGNANANQRHGLECPEERDYYPYWHPSPWHDIVVLTSEPNERCEYYRTESQNVQAKGFCNKDQYNNPTDCAAGGGTWQTASAFNEPPPQCTGAWKSRDNHNGNVRDGRPMYWVWRIPEHLHGRCVLRLRYNISTKDFGSGAMLNKALGRDQDSLKDQFFLDEKENDANPVQRRRVYYRGDRPLLPQNPSSDFIRLGPYLGSSSLTRALQLQVHTDQYGRTFEDRTHTFLVYRRPEQVPESTRIVNYNVRGRRGNIVQVYPSVEYDFVPQDLVVEEGTFLHFQWTGSDANPKGNEGHGRAGTDRSNLVQVATRSETVPLPIEWHTLFFDAKANPDSIRDWHQIVGRFAFLDQDANVRCDAAENDQQVLSNCKQLNGASAYFDGGLVEMTVVGAHHITSTRNNDFSNHAQKATITVVPDHWAWYSVMILFAGIVMFVSVSIYLGVAIYGFMRPSSWLFSKMYRPRIIGWVVRPSRLQRKIEQRRAIIRSQREDWRQKMVTAAGIRAAGSGSPRSRQGPRNETTSPSLLGRIVSVEEAAEKGEGIGLPGKHGRRCTADHGFAKPWIATGPEAFLKRCKSCGFQEKFLGATAYVALNIILFVIGLVLHLGQGFRGEPAYAVAKAWGFSLDLNLAMVVLPTLKSLQTALRGTGATREWLPTDDPISFHVLVAFLIFIGTIGHSIAHLTHMLSIAKAPPLQRDTLAPWAQPEEEIMSGMPLWNQIWNTQMRCAPATGIISMVLMAAMFVTSVPCCRRATNCCTRRLGGYNVFWRVHGVWHLVYLLMLIHAPIRFWIWLFFPTLFVLVDRMLLAKRKRPYVVLKEAKSLPRDVIGLTFEVPTGFTYQAGQYVLLGWRGEWHPFTLTSAPEEACLSVHIRASKSLDWCSALRAHLITEAPRAALGHVGNENGTVVQYEKCLQSRDHAIYCRPSSYGADGASAAPESTMLPQVTDSKEDTVDAELESVESLVDGPLELPPGAVALQLSGPFGAPAQKVWQFETIMVVGAGIGVTPFVSILRSVQLRVQQKEAILGAFRKSNEKAFANGIETTAQTHRDREAEGEELQCITPSCIRPPWNGQAGQPCCRTCERSHGRSHGPDCNSKFGDTQVVAAPWDLSLAPPLQPRSTTPRRWQKDKDGEMRRRRAGRPHSWTCEGHCDDSDAHIIAGVCPSPEPPLPPPLAAPPLPLLVAAEEAARRRLAQSEDAHANELRRLVQTTINVPRRIHFYWIVRSQEEFDWFYDLLAAAVEGPARDIVSINVFTTGEIELSQVRPLACAHTRQFFGRPNWSRIFKELRSQHHGEHIGVFLCGSPMIGAELARQSAKHTDSPNQPGGTRFSFFEEHF